MHRFHGVQAEFDEEMYVLVTRKHIIVHQWATDDCSWTNTCVIARTSQSIHAAMNMLRRCKTDMPAAGKYNIPYVHEDEYVDEYIEEYDDYTRVDVFAHIR